MKRMILLILGFILICFLIPILFVNKVKEKPVDKEIKVEKTINAYDYKKYKTVKLLHSDTDKIEELPIDGYLYGVVSGEMPANFEEEALKAQAIVARTYTMHKIIDENKHKNADICDDSSCCQVWISKEDRFKKWAKEDKEKNWNKIVSAVDSTQGKIITYEGKPINAFFHANSGGKTEEVINVWGGNNYPYLKSVETIGENNYSQYKSEVTISKEELVKKVKKYHNDIKIEFGDKEPIKILERTDGDRIKIIRFGNIEVSGVEARTILGLKSANFNFKIEGDNIKFSVLGYGHGVGMSQTGADSMAKQGAKSEEIIKHFYTGVEIVNI